MSCNYFAIVEYGDEKIAFSCNHNSKRITVPAIVEKLEWLLRSEDYDLTTQRARAPTDKPREHIVYFMTQLQLRKTKDSP
jgi:hypothetical protein